LTVSSIGALPESGKVVDKTAGAYSVASLSAVE
jgi:hypothetical protein